MMLDNRAYNILMPLAMIAIVILAAIGVLNFALDIVTGREAVRVTVEQPVDNDSNFRVHFPDYVPPKN